MLHFHKTKEFICTVCVYALSGREYMQFLLLFLSLLILEIHYHGWDPIDWFSPATYPCLSQTRPLISIGICSVLLFDKS